MKLKYIIGFLLSGVLFGILLTKAEVISWFRIQEMFRFQSFHMFGIIGSAVATGMIGLLIAKKLKWKSLDGMDMVLPDKDKSISRYLIGGTIFGLGWALTGACPAPMYILVGNGYLVFLVVILSAIAGTFVYGLLREKLPH